MHLLKKFGGLYLGDCEHPDDLPSEEQLKRLPGVIVRIIEGTASPYDKCGWRKIFCGDCLYTFPNMEQARECVRESCLFAENVGYQSIFCLYCRYASPEIYLTPGFTNHPAVRCNEPAWWRRVANFV